MTSKLGVSDSPIVTAESELDELTTLTTRNCQWLDSMSPETLDAMFTSQPTLFPSQWSFLVSPTSEQSSLTAGPNCATDPLVGSLNQTRQIVENLQHLLAEFQIHKTDYCLEPSEETNWTGRLDSIHQGFATDVERFSKLFEEELKPWIHKSAERLVEHQVQLDPELGPAVRELKEGLQNFDQLIKRITTITDAIERINRTTDRLMDSEPADNATDLPLSVSYRALEEDLINTRQAMNRLSEALSRHR
ncbi:hypothetical protein IWQ62_005511 [Dispira parvispora]|uniref:Uncharacterized protein n=1 Tax=Dispira parvispora TaxID=1520584 RepID=A0A9W8AQB9_9FUNG|nr:hypothetical protein IWQ62_005511 [Dispira parvispora]